MAQHHVRAAGAWGDGVLRRALAAVRGWAAAYLANDDPLAAAANAGAFLVWGSQPLYPFYVWLLVGKDAWPALLTWLSTPLFVAVPLLARQRPLAGRALFVIAGVANTVLATKAFGTGTAVGWFLVPCLVIALGFFQAAEWRVAALLCAACAAAGLALIRLGAPLVDYDPAQRMSLSHLNLWSVLVLTAYLIYGAWRAHRA